MLEDLFKMVKDRFNEEQKDVADSSAPEIPKDLLFKCPRCQNVFYMDEFEKRKKTCPVCNYHARLSAKERLDITVDKDSFKPFDENMVSLNPRIVHSPVTTASFSPVLSCILFIFFS